MMDAIGHVTAEGISTREAIGRRAMIGLERIITEHKAGRLSYEAAGLMLDVMVEVLLPFCDPTSKDILTQAQSQWQEGLREREELGRDLDSLGDLPSFK